MKTPITIALIFTGLIAAACGPEDALDNGIDDDELGTTSSAIFNVDACAMGSTANATGTLYTPGDYESYSRSASWINSICPGQGKDRKTTMVDFLPSANNAHRYGFGLQPTFTTANNIVDCVGQLAALRLMRKNKTTGQWEEVDYVERTGVWTWTNFPIAGKCTSPQIVVYRQNFLNSFATETNAYRVRAIAKNANGTYATVLVSGFNQPYIP